MAEALEALDDRYAIFGFSGYGREQVELFSIKDFDDSYSQETKNRICGIQPRKSTRMGPAIRHATNRLRETDSDHQLLIMLSDGYPQDMNYGEDRTSQTYALHDTRMALVEARRSGIRPFCITVDQCGDDYLRKMIDPSGYLVIKDIYSLPAVLPRVVESLMG
ncbi:MAG: nitric oxide reductase activation protein NorD, partial [SAR324 cluster bacterium]|nr:nitric oxide reductase activation protein NorD [SAR324 cluster bacterium]